MDDALAPWQRLPLVTPIPLVLILVVMDDALAQAAFSMRGIVGWRVLILVVMDDALAQMREGIPSCETRCLNPCCNG